MAAVGTLFLERQGSELKRLIRAISRSMGAADVVVLPFLDLLTSGSVVLAMSCGKPCLSRRVGCVADSNGEAPRGSRRNAGGGATPAGDGRSHTRRTTEHWSFAPGRRAHSRRAQRDASGSDAVTARVVTERGGFRVPRQRDRAHPLAGASRHFLPRGPRALPVRSDCTAFEGLPLDLSAFSEARGWLEGELRGSDRFQPHQRRRLVTDPRTLGGKDD